MTTAFAVRSRRTASHPSPSTIFCCFCFPYKQTKKVHCDEALACAMLKILPEWSDAVIVRTRDEAELAKCDAVVDVGGVYDPATLRSARWLFS